MRKGRDGEKKTGGKKTGKKGEKTDDYSGHYVIASSRPPERWNAARSCQKKEEKKKDENSGHYVIASSRLPERRPLERRTLMPIIKWTLSDIFSHILVNKM